MATGGNRLFVLAPSHYCERARWGLDHAGVPYTEERWAIGPHVALARRLAPGTTLPILATRGAVIQGSGPILDWLAMPGGDPEVERRLEGGIGVLARQFLYAGTLATPAASAVRELTLEGVSAWQARIGRMIWPAMRRLMISRMNARPELVPKLAGAIEVELDWFERRLGGRLHLVGDRFGRADLTAASLLSPLAAPPERTPRSRVAWPAPLAEHLARWRARPALRWVLNTYARDRLAPAALSPA